jgi:glycosyltransferase involved in cell wall biosynthesis
MFMKILFLGESDSPNTMNWISALRKLGCEVVLASARVDGSGDTLPIGGQSWPPRLRILFGKSSLKRIISNVQPDLIIAYRVTSYGFLGAVSGFHPLVIAAQNEQITYLPKPSRFRRWLLSRFAKFAVDKADLLHAWSDNIAEGLKRFGAENSRILVLHRGIDVGSFAKIAEKRFSVDPSQRDATPCFISTRSLYPEYRLDLLLKSFAEFVKDFSRARLNVVGDGPERRRLANLAESLGVADKVSFYGKVGKEKLLELLERSNFYISLIATEGMSSSLLEAIASGLYPMVADMPASRLLVRNGRNGLLLRGFTPAAVAAAMRSAVALEPESLDALKENSRKISEKFDVEVNQRIFLERYAELIARKQFKD